MRTTAVVVCDGSVWRVQGARNCKHYSAYYRGPTPRTNILWLGRSVDGHSQYHTAVCISRCTYVRTYVRMCRVLLPYLQSVLPPPSPPSLHILLYTRQHIHVHMYIHTLYTQTLTHIHTHNMHKHQPTPTYTHTRTVHTYACTYV